MTPGGWEYIVLHRTISGGRAHRIPIGRRYELKDLTTMGSCMGILNIIRRVKQTTRGGGKSIHLRTRRKTFKIAENKEMSELRGRSRGIQAIGNRVQKGGK